MDQPLDIREVARRTGLTSRALRFYEARGLLTPLRSFNGRRFHGRGGARGAAARLTVRPAPVIGPLVREAAISSLPQTDKS